MTVTAAQIQIIRKAISEVTLITLYDDLLDHLCCAIEDKMGRGLVFEEALHEAINELAPYGVDEIQAETLILLNSKINHMKKLMYSIGLVATICISMGMMFKLLHMPGGEQLLNSGFISFIVLFLPLYAHNYFQSNKATTVFDRWQFFLGIGSAIVILSALIFKMMYRLAPAEFLFIAGVSVFSFGFLPVLFLKMYRRAIN